MDHPEHHSEWDKAVQAKFYARGKPFVREDWDRFLGEYAVLSDIPVLAFSEELLAQFPDVSALT
jgi:hypothetical protein